MATSTKKPTSQNGQSPQPGRLKGWDQYVSEAKKPNLVLPITDEEDLVIEQPNGRALQKFVPAMQEFDVYTAICCIVGDEPGKRLIELCEDAPLEVLPAVLNDIMEHFGIDTASLGTMGSPTPIGPVGSGESSAS